MKTRAWVILLAALFALALWGNARRTAPGSVATISRGGEVIRSVDLSRVREEERFLVEGDAGSNLVVIQPGRVCIAEADCPDQICVLQGWLTEEGGLPIVCLPHGLVIEVGER